jgi:FMN phosphatase YigB (HAD superfamily)
MNEIKKFLTEDEIIDQIYGHDKGAASVENIFEHHNLFISKKELMNEIKSNKDSSSLTSSIIKLLLKEGFEVEARQMTIDDLTTCLDHKLPVMVLCGENYLTATKYDDKYIYFKEDNSYITHQELLTKWTNNDERLVNFGIIVGKKIVKESSNFPVHENVTHLLLDMDHVLFLYDKFCEDYKLTSGFISILRERKKKKITWEHAVKNTGIDSERTKIILNTICEHSKINPEIKLLIEKFSKKYPELQTIITTDVSPYVASYFLVYHKLNKYFNFLWCPEKAEWHWKKDKEYFELLQKKLGVKYENMLLIDNDIENTKEFSLLGGQVIHYDKGNYTFDTHERIS